MLIKQLVWYSIQSGVKWWLRTNFLVLLYGFPLHFVQEFKYLGHIINMDCSDNQDIDREIRNLFMRSNILIRRYSKCSTRVKLALFKTYCLCLYDAGIWSSYSVAALNKLRSCYNKCTIMFFGYDRLYSVTLMMTELGLPTAEWMNVAQILYFLRAVNSSWSWKNEQH